MSIGAQVSVKHREEIHADRFVNVYVYLYPDAEDFTFAMEGSELQAHQLWKRDVG